MICKNAIKRHKIDKNHQKKDKIVKIWTEKRDGTPPPLPNRNRLGKID